MSVVSIRIKNFLSIGDVEIKPGQVNQITGKNNQGKTSLLKALEFAIKGSTDGSLVKFGEDQAEVLVELDDKTLITRKLKADGKQTLSVYKDEFKAQSPQAVLDALFEESSFNPLELLDPKKRNDAILSSIPIKIDEEFLQKELSEGGEFQKIPIPPVDYTKHGLKALEEVYKYFYQRRAEANKDALDKKKRWETYLADLPKDEPLPFTEAEVVNMDYEARRKLGEAQNDLKRVESQHAAFNEKKIRYEKYLKVIEEIDADIEKLQARKAEGLKYAAMAKAEIPEILEDDKTAKEKVAALYLEAEKINGYVKDIETFRAKEKNKAMVNDLKKDYESSQAIADKLDVRVNKLSGPIKKKLMAQAEMPVTGLQYEDGVFTIDGVLVDNLSSSKALQLAVAVARKKAIRTKLICIDGAELLDSDAYESFRKEIEGDGYTYFLTKVGDAYPYPNDKVLKMDKGQVVQ